VYDVTKYLPLHPGGKQLISRNAGKDITDDFEGMFHSIKARDMLEKYEVGVLKSSTTKKRGAANQLLIPSRMMLKPKVKQGLRPVGSAGGSKPRGGPYVFGAYGNLKPSIVGRFSKPKEEVKKDDASARCLPITLTQVRKLTHNTSIFLFKVPRSLRVPLGYHIYALLPSGKNSFTKRPYTPVRCKKGEMVLVVKLYPDGVLSKHFFGLKPGDVLKISQPIGSFSKQHVMEQSDTVLLLAAGTGITPLYSVLLHLAKVHYQRRVVLLFWNKTKKDMILQAELEKVLSLLKDGQGRFLASKEVGRLSKDQLEKFTDVDSFSEKSFVAVCGPPAFNRAAESTLKDLKYCGVTHVFE